MKTEKEKLAIIQREINKINSEIQFSTGKKQEILHKEISELKSILGVTFARRENFENRIDQNREKETNLKERLKIEINALDTEKKETLKELKSIIKKQNKSEKILEKKSLEEQKLYEKYQKLYSLRNKLQDRQKVIEWKLKKSNGADNEN